MGGDGGRRGWWMGGNDGWAGMAEGVALLKVAFSRMPWLCEACHSRESGNLEAFAMGRLALEGWPWVSGPRSGSGNWNDVGAVDSRFHGNDRWAAMAVGGNDGRAGMGVGGSDRWAGMSVGGNDGCRDSQNPSFPRKRESRDLCDRKAGIGRAALGSWSPVGVGDGLRGMMEAQWIPVFTGMTGGGEWG